MLAYAVMLIIIGCISIGIFKGLSDKNAEPRKWCR